MKDYLINDRFSLPNSFRYVKSSSIKLERGDIYDIQIPTRQVGNEYNTENFANSHLHREFNIETSYFQQGNYHICASGNQYKGFKSPKKTPKIERSSKNSESGKILETDFAHVLMNTPKPKDKNKWLSKERNEKVIIDLLANASPQKEKTKPKKEKKKSKQRLAAEKAMDDFEFNMALNKELPVASIDMHSGTYMDDMNNFIRTTAYPKFRQEFANELYSMKKYLHSKNNHFGIITKISGRQICQDKISDLLYAKNDFFWPEKFEVVELKLTESTIKKYRKSKNKKVFDKDSFELGEKFSCDFTLPELPQGEYRCLPENSLTIQLNLNGYVDHMYPEFYVGELIEFTSYGNKVYPASVVPYYNILSREENLSLLLTSPYFRYLDVDQIIEALELQLYFDRLAESQNTLEIEKNMLANKRFTPEDKDKFVSEAAENVNSNYFEAPRVQKRGPRDVMRMMGKNNDWNNNDEIFDAKRLPTICGV